MLTSPKLARRLMDGPETVPGPQRTKKEPLNCISIGFPAFHSTGTKKEHFCSGPGPEAVQLRLPKEVPMTGQENAECDIDPIEADVAAVIEACGGDARTAVKALLVEQLIQEQRIERLAAALSFGYVRGRVDVTAG